ncbi:MAG: hypothetical protein GX443_06760 [Deltaproteobacteria bacterium]|nr:hypothetical protein [Deltaproteobacteria bacterium]
MVDEAEDSQLECIELTDEQKNRASAADEAYCRACEEKGVKVCNWGDFDAWMKFVDGKIDESTLEKEAKKELSEYSRNFGKYLLIEKDEPVADKDAERKDRARRANGIYKKVCRDRNIGFCFFNNFAAWSDFVEGRISDAEFYEKANEEVDRIKSQQS